MAEILVALRQVTKAYPGTLAARNITIEFCRGEIHGVVGENGAGKSTLVKILAGLIQPDQGYVEVENQSCRFANPRASLLAGIGVVHQAGSLIETLTAQENLKLGRLYSPHNSKRMDQHPIRLPGVPLNHRVKTLTMRQRQLVEIHRLMLQDAQLLVLDEPTAALTKQESALLFRDLETLAKAGHGIVVISHKLAELVSHCHRFTVLRKGQIVANLKQRDATVSDLVRLCGGSPTADSAPAINGASASNPNDASPLVQFKAVTSASPDDEQLCEVDLILRPGEILGIAGRSGSGVSTLLKLLRNEPSRLSNGTIERNLSALESSGDQAIGYVPADRVAQGVILDLSIAENLKLRRRGFLGKIAALARRQEQRKFVESLIARFDIQPARPEEKVRNLSGGNMQKVLLARELDHSKTLLIVASPTAGLDMGSAAFVRRLLRQKANEGACVVIHSDDLDELAELSSRVIVLIEGRCAAELSGDEINSDAIGLVLSEVNVLEPNQGFAIQPTQRPEAVCAD